MPQQGGSAVCTAGGDDCGESLVQRRVADGDHVDRRGVHRLDLGGGRLDRTGQRAGAVGMRTAEQPAP